MKNLLLTIFMVVSLTAITFGQFDTQKVVLENVSKLTFTETVNFITKNAEEKGWKVPVVHDLQKSVSNAGYEVNPVHVIEICNPHFASQILSNDKTRIITPMMPLRISIYEKEDGTVIIARLNPEMVAKMFGNIADDTLLEACAGSEEIVKEIIIIE